MTTFTILNNNIKTIYFHAELFGKFEFEPVEYRLFGF